MYTPTQVPPNLDVDGLRKWVTEEFVKLSRAYQQDTVPFDPTSINSAISTLNGQVTTINGNITTINGQLAQADDTVVASNTIALTTNVIAQVATINIPAGTWDVFGSGIFSGAGATTSTESTLALNAATATLGTTPPLTDVDRYASTGDRFRTAHVGPSRLVLGATTAYFLNARAIFATSTYNVAGWMMAKRVIV